MNKIFPSNGHLKYFDQSVPFHFFFVESKNQNQLCQYLDILAMMYRQTADHFDPEPMTIGMY